MPSNVRKIHLSKPSKARISSLKARRTEFSKILAELETMERRRAARVPPPDALCEAWAAGLLAEWRGKIARLDEALQDYET
jgi:hypothetical protein